MVQFQIKGSAAVVASIAFGLIAITVGTCAIWWSQARLALAEEVGGFVAMPATVLSVDVKGGGRTSGMYPDVRFEYEVDGRRYESDEFSASPTMLGSRPQAEAYLAEHGFTPGAVVEAYYDPGDPSQAVLSKAVDENFGMIMWFVSGVGCLFGVVGVMMVAATALSPSHRARLRTGR